METPHRPGGTAPRGTAPPADAGTPARLGGHGRAAVAHGAGAARPNRPEPVPHPVDDHLPNAGDDHLTDPQEHGADSEDGTEHRDTVATPTWRERLALRLRARVGARPGALAALAGVLLLAVALAGHHYWSGRPQRVTPPPVAHASARSPSPRTGEETAPTPDGQVVVDVAGKVRRPGLYRLPAGSRVDDALRAAGGLRRGTDPSGVNRARLLVDGEQLLVGVTPAAGAAEAGPSGGPAQPGARLSLNTATAEQLETLPGVGPVLAQHILEYRRQQGGFSSVDQLREVNGIGERRFADLASRVTP